MDLKLTGGEASVAERTAVDAHVAVHGTARDQLLPLLHAVNDRIGWISPGAIDHLSVTLDVAPAEIFGVASFYDLFSFEDRSGPTIHRCVDIACQVNGATVGAGERASPCLGRCEQAPAALLIEAGEQPRAEVYPPATADRPLASWAILGSCCSGASGSSTPAASTTTGLTMATTPCAGPSLSARPGCCGS